MDSMGSIMTSLSLSIDKVSKIDKKKIMQIDKKELENKFIHDMRSMANSLSQSIKKYQRLTEKYHMMN